jgi:osmotically-inducible protein OsmY
MINGVREVINDIRVALPEEIIVPPDTEMRQRVENLLLWNPDIDSNDIQVSVDRGWVTLQGTVDAYWKKFECEDLSSSVSGTVGVTNELAVVPTKDYLDTDIAEDIISAIKRGSPVDIDNIDVQVSHGQITLTGVVPDTRSHITIARMVERTAGVRSIINNLQIA